MRVRPRSRSALKVDPTDGSAVPAGKSEYDCSGATDVRRGLCGGSCLRPGRLRCRSPRAAREAPERRAQYAWAIGATRVDGYLFGRHGYMFEHLGPIGARDEGTARLLSRLGVCGRARRPAVHRRCAAWRASWVEWLESQGFTLQRPFTRMRRGERRFRDRADHLFAIAGPEFG